jgi:molybdate transport system regulatory protein
MTFVGPLKIKAQVLCGSDFAMGPGKADLLEAIMRAGSIAAAGRALGMSYRRAWMLVDTMNRCWTEPIVEAKAGGGEERGARVTPRGVEILEAYRDLERTLANAAAGQALDLLKRSLRSEPASPPLAPLTQASAGSGDEGLPRRPGRPRRAGRHHLQ